MGIEADEGWRGVAEAGLLGGQLATYCAATKHGLGGEALAEAVGLRQLKHRIGLRKEGQALEPAGFAKQHDDHFALFCYQLDGLLDALECQRICRKAVGVQPQHDEVVGGDDFAAVGFLEVFVQRLLKNTELA